MAAKSAAVPDAWDDDWVNIADKPDPKPSQPEDPPRKPTKAERRAQHHELQKQLWDSAETPSRNIWLEAQGVVPLKSSFKPQVTLLARKPAPTPTPDENEPDSEDEARRKREAESEERRRKAVLEREEKQRKYAEARERIMGTSTPSTGAGSRESSLGRGEKRGSVRGGMGGGRGSQTGSADQSPARQPRGPDSSGRGGSGFAARGGRAVG